MKPSDVIPIVIQAEAAIQLVQEAAAQAHLGITDVQKSLAKFKKAGELLIEAKKAVGHGQWTEHLKKHWPLSEDTARQYMRIAREWSTVWATGSIREGLRVLTEAAPDEHEEPKNEHARFLCERCTRLNYARPGCEQCAELRGEQADTGEGRASARPGSGGSGRAGGSGTTHRPSPPNEERQAELDWENRRTNDLRVRQALQRCRNAVEGLAEDFDVLIELRAADMLELTRLHGVPTDIREHESMSIVDGQTQHTLVSETYSPALEGLDRVFRDLAAREVGP